MSTRRLHALDFARLLETVAQPAGRIARPMPPQGAPAPQGGAPPKDSILGAVVALMHTAVDGMIAATPKTLQTASATDRAVRPVRVHLRGTNTQGLPAKLDIAVDMDPARGLKAFASLVLTNAQGQVVANPRQAFACGPADSVKTLVKQYQEWIGQAEALQTAPISATGAPVYLQ